MLRASDFLPRPIRPTKYRSRATGGYASAKEARRAAELKLLEKAGEIANLREQVPFVLIPAQEVNGVKVERPCKYVADFMYLDRLGNRVVEDCKSEMTRKLPEYIIKRKLLLWVHKIRIRET